MASVPEQIAELGRLLERGLITRTQFEEQRDRLLSAERPLTRQIAGRPDRIGAYQVLGTIGEGGMGVVYRGRHRSASIARRQGGEVAVKVLHPRLARNESFVERFEQEAALGMELDHPGLVRAHDLVFDGDQVALVMELVEGTLLSDHIGKKTGAIRWDDTWKLFYQVLDAVAYAHNQGVIHRDLKPDNIILAEDGTARVIDLGIAKGFGSNATQTGLAMGTVDYMAPEQHEDAKRVDARADVYSLAMTLYEMLAGRLPWDDSLDSVAILSAKRRGRFVPPTHFVTGIPSQVVRALMPALDPDPRRRYASVEDLCHALETAHFRTALGEEEASRLELEAEAAAEEQEAEIEPARETVPPVLEQTASGRFQAVQAAREYRTAPPTAIADPPPVRGGGAGPDGMPAAGAVARFWRSVSDESTPELPARLAEIRARSNSRVKGPRRRPGAPADGPARPRAPEPLFKPMDPRSLARLQLVAFVAGLLVIFGFGMDLWWGYATDLRDLKQSNEGLSEEVLEQKETALEVDRLIAEETALRETLEALDKAERLRRVPSLTLDRIEVSQPQGSLWIERVEIGEAEFAVEAFVREGSTADEIFMERLEAGSLIRDVKLSSRTSSDRPGGPYDRVLVEGSLRLPEALPKVPAIPAPVP